MHVNDRISYILIQKLYLCCRKQKLGTSIAPLKPPMYTTEHFIEKVIIFPNFLLYANFIVNTGGPSSEDPKKRVFLFVMPLMNKGSYLSV